MKSVAFPLLLLLVFASCRKPHFSPDDPPPARLSDFGFFTGKLSELHPSDKVIPYDLSTALFSDYAFKQRLILLPEGGTIAYHDTTVFDFPVGTCIAKTFYYPEDPLHPKGKKQIMETRVLIRRTQGWEGFPYVWNDDQTDAVLTVAGIRKDIEFTAENGTHHSLAYSVPNKNQCINCHDNRHVTRPIGPRALFLNKTFDYGNGRVENQLDHMQNMGVLTGFPGSSSVRPSPMFTDTARATLNDRARAYLDINCAHCHNPGGAGGTTGLDLSFFHQDRMKMGICKMPVAAGHGSGAFLYSISPGQPDSSIIVYRMQSTELGVMMPELGRKLVHREGVALIREWIASLEGDCREK